MPPPSPRDASRPGRWDHGRGLPRPLSDREEALLRFLAGDGRPGAEQLLASIPHLLVVHACRCGCDTVDVQHDGMAVPQKQVLFAEAAERGGLRMVMVLVGEDRVTPTCLEVYSADGTSGVTFPSVEDLELLPREK